jgi:DNA (cytosine-5)-methyltransferase 1
MIRYVDAFSGLGGFSLGLRAAVGESNAKCVMAIDFNREVSDTFKDNFELDSFGDIREIAARAHEIPDHDVLFGGFPCQPFSKNGRWFLKNDKTVGDAEDRDNLFLELVKILQAKQPEYFVFENVGGIKAMKNKDGSPVLETIIENLEGAGYQVHHDFLDAYDFGVPQQRIRCIIVGTRNDLKDRYERPKPAIVSRTPAIEDILDRSVPDKYLLKHVWRNRTVLRGARGNGKQPNHDFPKGTKRYKVIDWLYGANKNKPAGRTGAIEPVAILYGDTPSGLPRQQDKIYSVLGISPTVATFSTPAVDAPEGHRMLTPRECARLQGFPNSYRLPKHDARAYKQVGNAVCVHMVTAVLKALLP